MNCRNLKSEMVSILITNDIILYLDQYVIQMFGQIIAQVYTCQPVFGQTAVSGGESCACQWYDACVDAIVNM